MPTNADFSMHITVGKVELPEYKKNGECYVECSLDTPYSYNLKTVEARDGVTEKQEVPVTPYEVKICAGNTPRPCFYKVFVDGQPGGNVICHPLETRFSAGYTMKGGIRHEYLFSMPALGNKKKRRFTAEKAVWVSTISVECWDGKCLGNDYPPRLKYKHATKADSCLVTRGKYMMTTTRVGNGRPFERPPCLESWKLDRRRSRLSVHYRMAYDLHAMGFCHQTIPFNISGNGLKPTENSRRANANISIVSGTGTPNEPIEIASGSDLSESEGITESRVNDNTRPRSNKRNLNTGNVNTKRMRTVGEDNTIFVAINDNEGRDINHNEQRNIERKATLVGMERDLDDSVTAGTSSTDNLLPEQLGVKMAEMAARQLVQATVRSSTTEHDGQMAARQWSEQWSAKFVESATQQFAQAMQKVLQDNPIQWNS